MSWMFLPTWAYERDNMLSTLSFPHNLEITWGKETRNYASVNLKKNPQIWIVIPSAIPVSSTPAPHSALGTLEFSLQVEKSPGKLDLSPQGHWHRAQAQAAQSCNTCAAAWHLHLLCCSWEKTLTFQPSFATASLQKHRQQAQLPTPTGLGAETKKDPNSWCDTKCYIENWQA